MINFLFTCRYFSLLLPGFTLKKLHGKCYLIELKKKKKNYRSVCLVEIFFVVEFVIDYSDTGYFLLRVSLFHKCFTQRFEFYLYILNIKYMEFS